MVNLAATHQQLSPLFQAISKRQCTRSDDDGSATSRAELRQCEQAGAGDGSGGFAKNPITAPTPKALAALAPYFPGAFCRQLTLRTRGAPLAQGQPSPTRDLNDPTPVQAP